jgi:anti-sigma factor RsiW
MDFDAQLKLQAYLDGELPEAEAREVGNWLARDREAVALHTELRNTRQALVGFEVGAELPESREFFWSKIEREIQRLKPPEPAARTVPLLARLRRLLVPVSGLALLLLAGLLTLNPAGQPGSEMETDDSGAFVYHDDAAGATLVWLSYPAESEVANNPEPDTID